MGESIDRLLGNLEGAQKEILRKLNGIESQLRQGQERFAALGGRVDSAHEKITEEIEARVAADQRIRDLEKDNNRARGAGYVILGLLTVLATWTGASVIAIINGYFHFHR